MAISRGMPSKTLEEILAEVNNVIITAEPSNAQVLPPVGETLDFVEVEETGAEWVDITGNSAEDA